MEKDAEMVVDTQAEAVDLRDLSWRFIRAANLDYSPAYIAGPKKSPVNGLIRTHVGYFRVAEDRRDGTRVLLHSFGRDVLTGQTDKDGSTVFEKPKNNDYDIYVVSAHRNVMGSVFRDDMQDYIARMRRHFKSDVNLHAREIYEETEDGKELKGVRFANKFAGFLLYKRGKKWRLRSYYNLRAGRDRSEQFTKIDEKLPGFFRRMFSLSRDDRKFDSFEEGFAYLQRLWAIAASKRFKGRRSPVDFLSLKGLHAMKVGAAAQFFELIDSKSPLDWGIALTAGAIVGLTGFTAADISGLYSFALAAGTMMGTNIAAKWLENKMLKRAMARVTRDEDARYEALRPYYEKNYKNDYALQSPDNEKRVCQKIDPEIMPFMRALDHEASDINYDNGEFSKPDNPMRYIERLCTAPFHHYGALFDIPWVQEKDGQIVEGIMVGMYPNGLLSLIHIDLKTRATRYYFSYREDFDTMGNLKKPDMEPCLDALPGGKAEIHKVTHRGGKNFGYAALSAKEAFADLLFKVGTNVRAQHAFGTSIAELFNVEGSDTIEPCEAEMQPMTGPRKRKPRAKKKLPAPAQNPA